MSFRLVLVYSGTILVHFVSFRCYSASFRHILVYSSIFRSVPFLYLVTAFRSTLISFILVFFWLILPCSGVILPRSGIFRYHSCSFCFIPVSFRFTPESFRLEIDFVRVVFRTVSFRLVPAYSGLFRYIPFRYIPFLCLVTPNERMH